jgi:RNA polymerase primary sigma factor
MTRALAAGALRITLPEAVAEAIDELTVKERRMLQVLGREPTPEELAAELDLSPFATSWSPQRPGKERDA